ncbi:ATP-binding cassette domain-containing protein, partial [Roseibium sp. SCP14]
MSAEALIEFQDVTKSYGALTVLGDLNFSVGSGEKISLIGPSGSGKTTILRILMTLETLTSGHILVDGEQLWHERRGDVFVPASEAHLHAVREKIGMVFQHFNLFPH